MKAGQAFKLRSIPRDEFDGLEQHAELVEDSHADKYVESGFYIIWVDYKKARRTLVSGDKVLVERVRRIDGKEMVERTIRVLARAPQGWVLESLCSTPFAISDIPYITDTDVLRICGLIIARHAVG